MTTEGPVAGAARAGFAAGMMGLGLLSIIYISFSLQWEPVPEFVPRPFAYLSGAILVLGASALAIRGGMAWGALVLAAFLGLWVVGLKIPEALATFPQITKVQSFIGTILGIFEDLGMACGAWTLYAISVKGGDKPVIQGLSGDLGLGIARTVFGVACLEYGVSHFAFAQFTAHMVPSWLPDRLFFAYLTGAGHICAGIALITGVLPRLAATLEALMMSTFVLLVHIPMVIWHRAGEGHANWTLMFVAVSLASSAWAVSGALKGQPWKLNVASLGTGALKKA
jgi:uncharacterized membrane protein YphA (DoxX/SURF4 family)